MTATNHILTGALIGGLIQNPIVAVPLALLSHFALDVLPHFGVKEEDQLVFKKVLLADSIFSCLALVFIALLAAPNALLMLICGIVAASPDLLWLPYFIAELKGHIKPLGWFSKFAKRIQWGEFPRGLVIEVAWCAGMTVFLVKLF